MSLPKMSLQALEAFERVAQSGSVQKAARREKQPGVTPLNRSTRPFVGY